MRLPLLPLTLFVGALMVLAGVFVYVVDDNPSQQPSPGFMEDTVEQAEEREEGERERETDSDESIRSVELAGVCIDVDVAESPEERAQGLSGRAELADGTGMLFVFAETGLHSFWMKDMRFSIDILWFSSDRRLVQVVKDASPESFPESFRPSEPALYVLEVPAGATSQYGVAEGNVIRFSGDRCAR
ncbi:MAG: DUF192 domain-containing protein [Candidatus Paceibacterota bacterium]